MGKKLFLIFTVTFLFSTSALADECRAKSTRAIADLKNIATDAEERTRIGICLVKTSLDKPEVAEAVLKIIKDGSEDLFLREDLIAAFADSPLRKRIKVEEKIAPTVGAQEKAAVDHTSSSMSDILAVTQAVKSMNEVLPISKLEPEYFRAIGEIAKDESNHVELRAVAVDALAKLSRRVVESGVYEEAALRIAHDSLKIVAATEESSIFYVGAANHYTQLAQAGLPVYSGTNSGRALASVPGKK